MSNLDRYAQLKVQISALEAELETLKPGIIEEMQKQQADQIEHSAGVFILQERRTWTYPSDIVQLDKRLKEEKKVAEQTGSATYEGKPVLVFKATI